MSTFSHRNKKSSVLNWGAVREIRRRYAAGETQGELCRAFDVSVMTIGRIVRGETWRGEEVQQRRVQLSEAAIKAEAAESEARFLKMWEEMKDELPAGPPPKQRFSAAAKERMEGYGVWNDAKHELEPSADESGSGLARLAQEAAKSPAALEAELTALPKGPLDE